MVSHPALVEGSGAKTKVSWLYSRPRYKKTGRQFFTLRIIKTLQKTIKIELRDAL